MRKLLPMLLLMVGSGAAAADFGIAIPADTASRPLATATADAQSGAENVPQLYTGRVGKVCQKQGCWMMLIDGDVTARVMTGHRFFLPTDTTGTAVVYGTLQRRELDAKTAEHFAKESDSAATPGVEYRIDALAIRIEP